MVSLADLTPIQPQIYLWQGDINRLKVEVIVNATNDCELIAGCYCLCISTGEFRFPNQAVAEVTVQTVKAFLSDNSQINVVFKDVD